MIVVDPFTPLNLTDYAHFPMVLEVPAGRASELAVVGTRSRTRRPTRSTAPTSWGSDR